MLASIQFLLNLFLQFLYSWGEAIFTLIGFITAIVSFVFRPPDNEQKRKRIGTISISVCVVLVVCSHFIKISHIYVPNFGLKYETLGRVQSQLEDIGLTITDISIYIGGEWEGYLKREEYETYNYIVVYGCDPKSGEFVKKDIDVELEIDGANIKSDDIELRNISNKELAFKIMLDGILDFEWDLKKVPKKMPDVTNISRNDAENDLKKRGISCYFEEDYSDDITEGHILSQKPEKGEKVYEDTKVVLTVSKGKKLVTVPEVVGFTKEDAEKKLKELGLNVMVEEEYDDNVEEEKVISQSLKKDESVAPNTEIKIVISKGKKPVEDMPVEDKPVGDKPEQTPVQNPTDTSDQNTNSEGSGAEQTGQDHETEQTGQKNNPPEDTAGTEGAGETTDSTSTNNPDGDFKDPKELPGQETDMPNIGK